MIEPTPNYAPGRTRRPLGHRVEPDGPDPETNMRTYLFREDAEVDAAFLRATTTWIPTVQYVGAWMRWTVLARRKSWSSGRDTALLQDGTIGKGW